MHRVPTHVAQKDHRQMREDAKDFMEVTKFELSGADPDDILNMDQTPLPFSYHPNTTLDSKGVREVITKCSTTDTKRATLAASVSYFLLSSFSKE